MVPYGNTTTKSLCILMRYPMVKGGNHLKLFERGLDITCIRSREGSQLRTRSLYIPATKYHMMYWCVLAFQLFQAPSNKEYPPIKRRSLPLYQLTEWQLQNRPAWLLHAWWSIYWHLWYLGEQRPIHGGIPIQSTLALYKWRQAVQEKNRTSWWGMQLNHLYESNSN